MATSAEKLDSEGLSAAVIASPNPQFRKRMLKTFESRSWLTQEVMGGAEALARIEQGACHALVLDHWLPDLDSKELAELVRARHPDIQVTIVDPSAEKTSQAWERGVAPALADLFRVVQESHEPRIPSEATIPASFPARVRPAPPEPLPGMLGESEPMLRAYRLARLVAPRSTTVLVSGQTGTGKELVARAIHQLSPRAERPFAVVNCAAIPEPLLEAELFGYMRGAFTGAFQSRLGRLQAAHGGSVLLDEVADLPLSMQAKLLRFLQEGEVQRLGSSEVIHVDARIIAATNATLAQRVAQGRFREDLYYRLAVFPIELVPLRNRSGDVFTLAQHFLSRLCQEAGVPSKSLGPECQRVLERHHWPGNVRELKQAVERAFILAEASPVLAAEHFALEPTISPERKFRMCD